MTQGSLRLRLLAAATIAIAIALSISGLVVARLFAQHVEAREIAELTNHFNQIVAAVEIDGGGQVRLTVPPADPRFERPHGGLYWQIETADGSRQRSRSLWDTAIDLPVDEVQPGTMHRHIVAGPAGTTLFAVEGRLTVGPGAGPIAIRLSVAVDRHDLETAVADFRSVLFLSLGVLGLCLVAALLAQVHVGLKPLEQLRQALKMIHSGAAQRFSGTFPSELKPLVEDLNALLARERRDQLRAKERAGDLAHGFKTPLAVLAAVARDRRRLGDEQSAAEIEIQVDIMGGHVRRELARARTTGASAIVHQRVAVAPILERIVKALGRISSDRALSWSIDADSGAVFRGNENDLLELIGNLADNASKWAATAVKLIARSGRDGLTLQVDDDGPGIPENRVEESLGRGRRLDETAGGTGLGLSIVAKIVEDYDGRLSLGRSPSGGLSVTVVLPG